MYLLTLISLLLGSFSLWASGLQESQILSNLADNELAIFDAQLEFSFKNKQEFKLSNNLSYHKLLVLRDNLEHPSSIIQKKIITSSSLDKKITKLALDNMYQSTIVADTIYPSTNRAGNVSGNRYPKNTWSLTYDDGPKGARTDRLHELLQKENIRATIFMLTKMASTYPATAQRVSRDMEIALHSYNHLDLNKKTLPTWEYEIGEAKAKLEDLTGSNISLFRLPYGSGVHNKNLRLYIAQLNMVHVFWNVDSLDWKDKDPKSIYNRVAKQMALTRNNSGVILFHDIHERTYQASKYVIEHFKRNNLKTLSVSEAIEVINKQ